MAHRRAVTADSDLDQIWYHTAKETGSVEKADQLVEFITERFILLSRNPWLGRRRDRDLLPGLRSFSIGPYVVIYRIEEEDVLLLHVFHGSRDIESFFRH